MPAGCKGKIINDQAVAADIIVLFSQRAHLQRILFREVEVPEIHGDPVSLGDCIFGRDRHRDRDSRAQVFLRDIDADPAGIPGRDPFSGLRIEILSRDPVALGKGRNDSACLPVRALRVCRPSAAISAGTSIARTAGRDRPAPSVMAAGSAAP